MHSPSPFRRFASLLLALLYFILCIGAAWWSAGQEPPRVKMAFVVFAFVFFLVGYLTFFYNVANFSRPERDYERQLLLPSPPPTLRTLGYAFFGFFWTACLLALLYWRSP